MAEYDLVIRGGEIHDGLGGDPVSGDVAVLDGKIAAVGKNLGSGREEIDAGGRLVTPGFVDIHTHYDGQATWEHRMSPSSNHGVTSVVMGNCGVGFAPCRPEQQHLLVNLMEGVEDIPEVVMTSGLPWNWETFPQYLDALDQRRLDIDISAQVPHSAVRVYVMGERGARQEPPTSDDLSKMRALTAEAIAAGAMGVTTSRNLGHRSRAGDLAPSLFSEEDELHALAGGLKDAGAGVMQMINRVQGDPDEEFGIMRRLAQTSGRPLSFTMMQITGAPNDAWRRMLALLKEANAEGLPIRGQVFPRPAGVLYGLDLSFHPFSAHPSFRPLEHLPLAEKVKAMRDPALKAKLLSEKPEDSNPFVIALVSRLGGATRMGDPPNYEPPPTARLDYQAAQRGMTPHELAYEWLLELDGKAILLLPSANYLDGNLDAARELLGAPHTVLGLGDGGAHYGMICDASYPTFLLEKWVRDEKGERRIALSEAIRSLTSRPAAAVGFNDRGRIAQGYKADLNVIDLDGMRLHMPTVARDLPAGGRRLRQEAEGYVATVKAGQVTYRDGTHTGALPGRLVRGAQAVPA